MKRRDFIQTSAAAGALSLAPGLVAEEKKKLYPSDPFGQVTLGKTGIKTSLMGMGTGFKGWKQESNQTRQGKESFVNLIKGAYDKGIRLFDMADLYGCHDFMSYALKEIPRDECTLISKVWTRKGGVKYSERPGARACVEGFLKDLKIDHIDIVHLHCMVDAKWPEIEEKNLEELSQLKKEGKIRAHGVSSHSFAALDRAIELDWVDVVNERINAYGDKMDGKPADVARRLRALRAAGKAVVGMKLVGGSNFANSLEKREQSILYALEEGAIDTMIVGFEQLEQIDDFSASVAKALKKLGS